MTRTRGLLLCACAVLACTAAGAARGGLDVGVTEDAGKTADGGVSFFSTLNDVGLKVNRVSINWDAANPTTIGGQAEIAAWLPQAQAAGTRIIFAVSPQSANGLTKPPGTPAQFAAFVAQLATTFPTVKDYVIGNEPNQPYFWVPQYSDAGKPLAAAQYLPVLAASYDALKAVDPTINVIGIGLSPRGNDQPFGKSNRSRSPVRFLNDLGVAYRASHRAKPLMDELAYHPYPQAAQGPPSIRYAWPTAGLANLDRIKQAVWDAFNGTAQPTFAEPGNAAAKPLRFDLDEVGWQVAPLPALASMYTGVETAGTKLITEPQQATYYSDTITLAECDPSVRYSWPTAGLANLDRIKQAVWDAFRGTAQPTFAESGNTAPKPLRFDLDEVGWQVAPLPALASLYTGVERLNGNVIGHFDITDHMKLSGEFMYARLWSGELNDGIEGMLLLRLPVI